MKTNYLVPGRYTVRVMNTKVVVSRREQVFGVAVFRLLEVHEIEDIDTVIVGERYTQLFNVDGPFGVEGASKFLFACDVPKTCLNREDVIRHFRDTVHHVGRILFVGCRSKVTKQGHAYHVFDWEPRARIQ